MAKKEKSITDKNKKVFRLVLLDDVSLKEYINLKLTKANIFTYGGALVILIGILVGLLFVFTPIKYFLPPVENYKLEKKILETSILIDSLEKEVLYRDKYFSQISNIITSNKIDQYGNIDTSANKNLLTRSQKDSILNELLKRDEENLAEIRNDNNSNVEKTNFYKPVSGVVSNNFDPSIGHLGVDIVAGVNSPVYATLQGTVVLATWSLNSGYVIQIQHSNNIISVYKHNSELLKKEGDKVSAGDPIALVGNTGEQTTGPHLHFEIWQDGVPVNPLNYINF